MLGENNNKKKGDYGTVNSKNLEAEQARMKKAGENKQSAAMTTSEEWKPITEKTYQFETRRKKSTSGYKRAGNKFFKSSVIVK